MCRKHTTGNGPFAKQEGLSQKALENIKLSDPVILGDSVSIFAGYLHRTLAKRVVQTEVAKFAISVVDLEGNKSPITVQDKLTGAPENIILAKPEDGVDGWGHEDLLNRLHLLYAPLGSIPPYFEFGFRLFPEFDERAGGVEIYFYTHKNTYDYYNRTVPWVEKGGCCNGKSNKAIASLLPKLSTEALMALPQKSTFGTLYRYLPLTDEEFEAACEMVDENCISQLIKEDGSVEAIAFLPDGFVMPYPVKLLYPTWGYIHPRVREIMQIAFNPSGGIFDETFTWGFVDWADAKGMMFICLEAEPNYLPDEGEYEIYEPPLPTVKGSKSASKKRCPACVR